MISVQIDGSWVVAEPKLVAQMILNGRAEQLTPARDLTQSEAEEPLSQFLHQSDFEELGRQILQQLQSMYLTDPEDVEPTEILTRVAGLCKWDWSDQVIKGRLLWVAGWLAELTGSFRKAITYYNAYLRHPTQESHLRLLAYNNRGVLRIRLGQAEGVGDLVRAAILMDPDVEESQQLSKLPAACFNLLNLVNDAFDYDVLRDQVENVLVDFMINLPKDVREEWLGPDPTREDKNGGKRPSDSSAASEVLPEALENTHDETQETLSDEKMDESDKEDDESEKAYLRDHLSILKDLTFERLNKLALNLLNEAFSIWPGSESGGTDLMQCAASQLNLWHVRPDIDVAGDLTEFDKRWQNAAAKHQNYAEAASLLFAHDIPLSLTPQENTIFWAMQFAQEALSRSEGYLAEGAYDLARRTLESLCGALDGWKGDKRVQSIVEEVERQLQIVDTRQRSYERLELHQVCADMAQEVKDFCGLTDICQAQREAEILQRRLEELEGRLQTKRQLWVDETIPVLDDLFQRVTEHLQELKRLEVEEKVKSPKQQLLDQWPDSWTKPVPQDVYEALALCRLNDPRCLVEDWDLIRSQLDNHQAQYYFRHAIRDISDGHADRRRVEETLTMALSLNPGLGSIAAPIFSLFSLPETLQTPEGLDKIQTDLLATATQLLETQPLGPDGVWSPAVRADLIRQACLLLKRLVSAFQGVGSKVTELWETLQKSFAPALTEGRPEIVDEVKQIVEACLEACPQYAAGKRGARWDPRNPLQILLETCERAELLGKGEQALNAEKPEHEAALGYFAQAIDKGLEKAEQLRRAVGGFYVARYGTKDPQPLQRKILDELDKWLDQNKGKRQSGKIRSEGVFERITEIRKQIGSVGEPETCTRDSPDARASESETAETEETEHQNNGTEYQSEHGN